jgi:hypothetical protein
LPRNNLFKIGVAVAAAAVGAILAITSVFAHTAPTTGGHSLMGSIVKAEITASFPLVSLDPAPNTITDEQVQDAIEAAELAAKIAAEQAALAAKQAALAAEEAAEAAPNACVAADQVEDTAEKAGGREEDATETESATEDANEKTARQAAEAAEPAETPCAGAESEHHSDGDKKSASATLSFKGEH